MNNAAFPWVRADESMPPLSTFESGGDPHYWYRSSDELVVLYRVGLCNQLASKNGWFETGPGAVGSSAGEWVDVDGNPIPDVVFWAPLPKGGL